ncbi:adenylyltransferase/cytidyltransferase family protein [Candidatus Protochlamydia phocaeensis]|uniref:adenylyltransferase/cytidyltransferase family protein n=1 Tax=Candidatus Protochlamydia phocaeensis TaxID=1414722 RepID=UPI000838364C|nr:adenylyltransferase/cytidyltransferase family protein [Candidatus Protochlamydia phocaeensis]
MPTEASLIPWSIACKEKVIVPEQLADFIHGLRRQGKRLVTLNGSFDLLHAGHLQIIFEASQLGDVLIVALNTDQSIKQYKSPKRPLIPLEYRMQMMAALGFVDYVTWFDETDPCRLLSIIKPDIHVNGSEYGENCIEADTVKAGGGRIHIVPLIPGLSTSSIIRKIQEESSACA